MKRPNVSALTDIRRDECYNELYKKTDRELLESVKAHFESHPPRFPGESALKRNANKLLVQLNFQDPENGSVSQWLNNWGNSEVNREEFIYRFAETRVCETPFRCNPHQRQNLSELRHSPVNDLQIDHVNPNQYVAEWSQYYKNEYGENAYIGKSNVVLQKSEGGVRILGECSDGNLDIGFLFDTFLAENPMNVDSCNAELVFVDFSDGDSKDMGAWIVVDTDKMSGDVIMLDNDMADSVDQEGDNGFEHAVNSISTDDSMNL